MDAFAAQPARRRPWPWWVAAFLLALAAWAWHLSRDPRVVLLRPSADGARWVRPDRPFDGGAHHFTGTTAAFVTYVVVPAGSGGNDGVTATLRVTALRRVVVSVDGLERAESVPRGDWRTPLAVPVRLGPGRHSVRLDVVDGAGPAVVRASCPALGLATGTGDWWASVDGGRTVTGVAAADAPWDPVLPPQFNRTGRDLLAWSPALLGLAVAGGWLSGRRVSGSAVRWAGLLAWAVLAANDIGKVPLADGYDVDAHYDYVRYVAAHAALPPPTGGWQFFQTPLYYVVSAALQRALLALGMTAGTVPYALRGVPLACGMVVAEMSFRAGRELFPGRGDLQAVATVVGGLLPVNPVHGPDGQQRAAGGGGGCRHRGAVPAAADPAGGGGFGAAAARPGGDAGRGMAEQDQHPAVVRAGGGGAVAGGRHGGGPGAGGGVGGGGIPGRQRVVLRTEPGPGRRAVLRRVAGRPHGRLVAGPGVPGDVEPLRVRPRLRPPDLQRPGQPVGLPLRQPVRQRHPGRGGRLGTSG